MARARRSNDWGFPRWRAYGEASQAAAAQRTCDRNGCDLPGTCPAPKAPDRPERWWFCEAHAAEYNRGWNYFEQLSDEEAAAEEARDRSARGNFREARHWGWNEGDGSRSRAELDALRLLDLPPDAGDEEVKASYRRMAKDNHPDLNPGNHEAAERFRAVQAAYEVLRSAAARRAEVAAAHRKSG